MPPPPTDRLRVVRYAPEWGYGASEWAEAISAIPWARPHADGGPQRLKITSRGTPSEDVPVWRATLRLGGRTRDVVLKVEPMRSLRKRLQGWLGWTKPFRQWNGAEVVEKAGFRAARPLAILRGRTELGDIADVLVLEALPGRSLLELIAWDGPGEQHTVRERHALASAVGVWTGDLIRADVGNDDHKPSNIIVLPDGGFALVDTVAVNLCREPEYDDRTRDLVLNDEGPSSSGLNQDDLDTAALMLCALWLEPAGIGHPISRATSMRAVLGLSRGSRPFAREAWRTVARYIGDHGDPTPKDDPLARG